MLIRFGVENYGSIRDYQEISFVASRLKDGDGGLIERSLPGLSGLSYLRCLAVYGPNAAGKSTLLGAIRNLRELILGSYGKGSSVPLPHTPFALDRDSPKRPTRYLVEFVTRGVRYRYELSHTAHAITGEDLRAYPKGKEQLWFRRGPRGVQGSTHVSVPKAALQLLNDNVPLLSFLANYQNLRSHEAIAPVYEWFRDGLVYLNRGPSGSNDFPFSGEIIDGNRGSDFARSFIREMVRSADLGISDVSVERREIGEDDRVAIARSASIPVDMVPDTMKSVVFGHRGPQGDMATFDMGRESDGTNRIFDLSGFVGVALEGGATMVVDELDASLHPTLLSALIRSFQDPDSNQNDAQLLFSAHNTRPLSDDLLRRDQVWLVDKRDGSTEVVPLTDYGPRKGEALEQGYLAGRYSAVPVVPRCFAPTREGK